MGSQIAGLPGDYPVSLIGERNECPLESCPVFVDDLFDWGDVYQLLPRRLMILGQSLQWRRGVYHWNGFMFDVWELLTRLK